MSCKPHGYFDDATIRADIAAKAYIKGGSFRSAIEAATSGQEALEDINMPDASICTGPSGLRRISKMSPCSAAIIRSTSIHWSLIASRWHAAARPDSPIREGGPNRTT